MPELDGIMATRQIRRELPEQLVIVLTGAGSDDHELGLQALRAGASGFLSKDLEIEALPRALAGLRAGSGRDLAQDDAGADRAPARGAERLRRACGPVKSPLTAREWEVIDLLKASKTTDEIADELVLSTGDDPLAREEHPAQARRPLARRRRRRRRPHAQRAAERRPDGLRGRQDEVEGLPSALRLDADRAAEALDSRAQIARPRPEPGARRSPGTRRHGSKIARRVLIGERRAAAGDGRAASHRRRASASIWIRPPSRGPYLSAFESRFWKTTDEQPRLGAHGRERRRPRRRRRARASAAPGPRAPARRSALDVDRLELEPAAPSGHRSAARRPSGARARRRGRSPSRRARSSGSRASPRSSATMIVPLSATISGSESWCAAMAAKPSIERLCSLEVVDLGLELRGPADAAARIRACGGGAVLWSCVVADGRDEVARRRPGQRASSARRSRRPCRRPCAARARTRLARVDSARSIAHAHRARGRSG